VGRGLTVAFSPTLPSNLAFVFPAGALAIVFVLAIVLDDRARLMRRLSLATFGFCIPGPLIALMILILPLRHARLGDFYYGWPTLEGSFDYVLRRFLFHTPSVITLAGRQWDALWYFRQITAAAKIISALVLTATAVMLFRIGRAWRGGKRFRALAKTDRFVFLTGGSLLLVLVLLVAAHHAFGVLYPLGRTGLYLGPLFLLTWFGLAREWHPGLRWVSMVWLLLLAHFGSQFRVGHYAEWPSDAGTRRIVQILRERYAVQPREHVNAGSSWTLEPGLNFYRRMYRLNWMRPVERNFPDDHYDFYVLLPPDTALVEKLRLEKIYEDSFTHAVVALPGR
jgi:hypothetical protein